MLDTIYGPAHDIEAVASHCIPLQMRREYTFYNEIYGTGWSILPISAGQTS